MNNALFFSTMEVTRQVFYRTQLSYAIVNLKPITPGHVLILPTRPVPRLADLTPPEIASLMTSVQHVGRVIERVYKADGLTVACQDGKAAGQSVPHVHFHVLPRRLHGDYFSKNDDIYPALDNAEGSLGHGLRYATENQPALRVDAEEGRVVRGIEEMAKEADWLKGFFPDSSEE